jgi:DNA-binding transcriptional LysR family regulator
MPRLSLDALEVLDAIDRKGSFAAAAAALYRVPSAVTYSVQKLEDDLGVRLFQREGRRSVLTPAGRVLLEQGRDILDAAERLVETTRQVHSGWESQLNIALDSLVEIEQVAPALEHFYREHPEIEITLTEEVLGGAWEAVIEGRADLVVGAAERPPTAAGLSAREFMQVEWVFAVHPDHPLATAATPLVRDDFADYRAVVVMDSSRSLPPQTSQTLRLFERQAVLRVETVQQKIAVQQAGLAVGFLPRHRIEAQLAAGELVELAVEPSIDPAPLQLVWKTGSRGRALRWFIEELSP